MPRGSAPGERRGGREKGTRNKRTEEQARAIADSGLTPLEYLMSIVRDTEASQELRIDAAAKAAPYVHPRLASTDVQMSSITKHVREMTEAELMAVIETGGKGT